MLFIKLLVCKRHGELETGFRKATSKFPSVNLDRATTPPRTSLARGSRKPSPAKESRQHTSTRIASESSKRKPAKDISEYIMKDHAPWVGVCLLFS